MATLRIHLSRDLLLDLLIFVKIVKEMILCVALWFMATHFNTQRIHLSRDMLLSDILIFVKIIKEMISCVALWNASAEATCSSFKVRGTACLVG